mgnify:CR=1 FL=1
MKKVSILNYKEIQNNKGNIYKLLDRNFYPNQIKGEVYLSQIKYNDIKAWRKHKSFEAIFIVISGVVQLKCMDNEKKLIINQELSLNSKNLAKVKPETWYGFKGISKNISSILVVMDGCHDESEIQRLNPQNHPF